jgi:ATP-dependent DNA helicase RecG
VEIVNPGNLVSGLKKGDLGKVGRPRNPLLFNLMCRMNLVEQIGSGILRINKALAEYHMPPVIETDNDWYSMVFKRAVSAGQAKAGKDRTSTAQSMNKDILNENEYLHTLETAFQSATGQVAAQVLLFCKSPKKASEIQKLLGFRHRETFLKNYLKPLLSSGWVTRTIPDKPKSKNQQYVITEQGKNWLKN